MKVKRQSKRNQLSDHYVFLIYDEKESYDEKAAYMARTPKSFVDYVDFAISLQKEVLGEAYGHPRLCYFTVYSEKPTQFEFDSDRAYSEVELKQILRLASDAKRRCKYPRSY